ncbi:MAG: hypothetical protein V4642_16470 [Bacteroidota bacterium]
MIRYFIIAVIAFVLISCNDEIQQPDSQSEIGKTGASVLCEGLKGYDNTTLYRYDAQSSTMLAGDFFKRANPALILGDTGNDLVVRGDTAYAVIAASGIIEIFKTGSGVSLGRIFTNAKSYSLSEMCFVNDSIAYVTSALENLVYEINVFKREVSEKINVGSFPEGIDFTGKYIVVTNSGYGDLGEFETKASTISIVDPLLKREIQNIPTGKNPIAVIAKSIKNKFYVLYNHLPNSWEKDSIGGIIEYDADSFLKTNEWKIASQSYAFAQSTDGNMLYALTPKGVEGISVLKENAQAEIIVEKTKQTDIWYALGVDPNNGNIWIGNARNHQVNGEVLVAEKGKVLKTFPVGVNPSTIVFF